MAINADAEGLNESDKRFAAFDDFYFRIESGFNFLAAAFIMGIMFLGVANVVGRTIFNQPVRGYVDIVEISITVFAFLALSYCQKLGGHIRMEIIIGKFKGRFLWVTETIGTLIAILVVVILLVYTWDHFMRAWSIGDSTMDIDIVLWPSKLMVPFAFTMLIIRFGINLFGFIRLAMRPEAVPIGVPIIETVAETAQHEIDAGLAGEEEKVDIVGEGGAKAGAD